MAGTLEARRTRLHRLRELEDLLIEEIQEEIFAEEVLSFLFQLEIFEGIPGVGPLSGAVLNGLFMRRVGEYGPDGLPGALAAGKRQGPLDRAGPGAPLQLTGMGWSGALGRVAYSGCYCLGFGVALPVYAVASLLRPMDNALVRGLRDGAAAASDRAEKLTARARGAFGGRPTARARTGAGLGRFTVGLRRRRTPHPPFGHLLPGGEKGTVIAVAEGGTRRDDRAVALAPTGRGPGEGDAALRNPTAKRSNSL